MGPRQQPEEYGWRNFPASSELPSQVNVQAVMVSSFISPTLIFHTSISRAIVFLFPIVVLILLLPGYTLTDIQFSSVTQSCPILCDPMNCSTPSLPVHHHLPGFTQNNIHRVRDAIQPSHPQSSPSPPAPNPSQPQSLFQ